MAREQGEVDGGRRVAVQGVKSLDDLYDALLAIEIEYRRAGYVEERRALEWIDVGGES